MHNPGRLFLAPLARTITLLQLGAILAFAGAALAAESVPPVVVDNDGTVHVAPMDVPLSSFLSDEAKQYMAVHLKDMQNKKSKILPEKDVLFFMKTYQASMQKQFPLDRQESEIGGIHVVTFTPKQGVKPGNEERVLINLHGGGFAGCYPGCAELESMPVASLGGIKVIAVDYRQWPKYHFPAASEDAAKVYRELLKTYKPENIGIYGCSAGGLATAQSLAWFAKEKLPMPGAAGVFCAGMTLRDKSHFGGDADYVTHPIGEANMPNEPAAPEGTNLPPMRYFDGADLASPYVSPANSLDMLAKFPPTLFITASRSFEFSSAIYSHGRMVKAGVDADLHVWDGLFHGFFYNPDVPESRDVYNVVVKFFDKHLGKRSEKN